MTKLRIRNEETGEWESCEPEPVIRYATTSVRIEHRDSLGGEFESIRRAVNDRWIPSGPLYCETHPDHVYSFGNPNIRSYLQEPAKTPDPLPVKSKGIGFGGCVIAFVLLSVMFLGFFYLIGDAQYPPLSEVNTDVSIFEIVKALITVAFE